MLDPDGYDAVAAAFDRYTERTAFPITECLLEMTGVRAGQAVLDVACGSGIVAHRAAALVGPSGRVTGIDLSPGQIHVARERSRALSHHWTEFLVMDALRLEFAEASFDVVLAQFPHLPDRRRCLAEMFRVLKPGGAVAVCNGGGGAPVWPLTKTPERGRMPEGARLDGLFERCLRDHFPELAEGSAGFAPGPWKNLRDELREAGFAKIALWSYAYTAPFAGADEAFEWESLRNSRYRLARDRLDPARINAFATDYRRRAQATFDQHGDAGLTTGALFGTGIRPPGGNVPPGA